MLLRRPLVFRRISATLVAEEGIRLSPRTCDCIIKPKEIRPGLRGVDMVGEKDR